MYMTMYSGNLQILDTEITCHSFYIKHSHTNIYKHFNISSASKILYHRRGCENSF